MKKRLKIATVLISCAIHLWVGLSYAEVVAKNTRPNPSDSEYNAVRFFIDSAEDLNKSVGEGDKPTVSKVRGKFEARPDSGWYMFTAHDESLWWIFNVEELGFTPSTDNEYTLIYSDNGTTECTACPERAYCECAVYDDILIAIAE